MTQNVAGRVVVLHAYSRANRGDALLVDLTIARLERQGLERSSITVVALDTESFREDGYQLIQFGTPTRRPGSRSLRSLASLGATWVDRGLHRRIGTPSALFGVGGGYLVGGGVVPDAGMLINHLAQLRFASQTDAPACYLPTGVQDLSGPVGRVVLEQFAGVDLVMARDDDSARELGEVTRTERVPDLAVLELADQPSPQRSTGRKIMVLARELGRDPDYLARLGRLRRLLPDAIWGVQVEGVGSKSDRRFYRSLGLNDPVGAEEVIRSGQLGAVISVRLHGALDSIGHGIPAIHLGYGRKSSGAYGDLGLRPWLHDARSFDPERVAQQARELVEDPRPYWSAVECSLPLVHQASRRLDEAVESALRRGGAVG